MKKIILKLFFLVALTIQAAEHEVKMLNFGDEGSMIFEPGFLKVEVGDTVHFKSVDMAHNSESVAGLIPWKGEVNQDISITLNEEGVYVYQCTPHLILGMIGVIQVGNPVNIGEVRNNVGKLTFAVNPERLTNYLNQVQ